MSEAKGSAVQASRKVRPILEQAAAAAAAALDAEGTAKAQAAAKKAKKLTPEEMNKMRQQADPNYKNKQAAAGNSNTKPKGKKEKGPPDNVDAAAKAAASVAAAKLPAVEPLQKDVAAARHGTAQAASQAQHDNASASGSKRRHGLGFSEDQPQLKKGKPPNGPESTAADGEQHVLSASKQDCGNAPAPMHQSAQQGNPATHQAAASSSADTPQGPPVIFTDECTAFVRGLDNKVTEDELKSLLVPCGEVKGVRLVMDKVTGRPKVASSSTENMPSLLVLHSW